MTYLYILLASVYTLGWYFTTIGVGLLLITDVASLYLIWTIKKTKHPLLCAVFMTLLLIILNIGIWL